MPRASGTPCSSPGGRAAAGPSGGWSATRAGRGRTRATPTAAGPPQAKAAAGADAARGGGGGELAGAAQALGRAASAMHAASLGRASEGVPSWIALALLAAVVLLALVAADGVRLARGGAEGARG